MKRSSFITWDQLRVGLVVLAALGILTLAVYKLGQAANLFAKRYTLIAYLKEANGLRQGGTVTLAGQLAGSIKDIQFLPVDMDTTRNLKVLIAIDQNFQQQIRRNSKAQIRTMGLLGDKVLDITPGTPSFPVLRNGDSIAVSPALERYVSPSLAVPGLSVRPSRSRRTLDPPRALNWFRLSALPFLVSSALMRAGVIPAEVCESCNDIRSALEA